MTTPEKKARTTPKGGRKGGSVFPRVEFKDAVSYARKLVSKTHSAPQPKDVIMSGVLGAKGGTGNVRMSALKQYGFLKGDTKNNFSADDLAKRIVAAPQEELVPLFRQAMLKPTIFKKLFDTFHGDAVSKAKLKQRASDLKVHPDETATCIDLYVSGMVEAELVTLEEDLVKHSSSSDIISLPSINAPIQPAPTLTGESAGDDVNNKSERDDAEQVDTARNHSNGEQSTVNQVPTKAVGHAGPRAVFNVNVTLDSSLDIEKLQKQLDLLQRFGAI